MHGKNNCIHIKSIDNLEKGPKFHLVLYLDISVLTKFVAKTLGI